MLSTPSVIMNELSSTKHSSIIIVVRDYQFKICKYFIFIYCILLFIDYNLFSKGNLWCFIIILMKLWNNFLLNKSRLMKSCSAWFKHLRQAKGLGDDQLPKCLLHRREDLSSSQYPGTGQIQWCAPGVTVLDILETGDRELANQYGRTGELQVQWKEDCLKNKVA